ncbi:hypothetical protein COU79_05000 [Candidatus Peregrinibacteria bacterium CG10_big_fil_rev_8_21_14_0_10_54_7]|nr:MAG: hypothetical protein COU79_05000 [Candidatus Peregrinibacteria bacterium CG10_big_fil_rev_8_21_14_0_10_54_7]
MLRLIGFLVVILVALWLCVKIFGIAWPLIKFMIGPLAIAAIIAGVYLFVKSKFAKDQAEGTKES